MATLKELQDAVQSTKDQIIALETTLKNCKFNLTQDPKPLFFGAAHFDETWISGGNLYDPQWCTGNSNQKQTCSAMIASFNNKIVNCRNVYDSINVAKAQLVIQQTALENFIKTDPHQKTLTLVKRIVGVAAIIVVLTAVAVYLKKKGVF